MIRFSRTQWLPLALFTLLIAALAIGQDEGAPPVASPPDVLLSQQHQAMASVGVGDAFPELSLAGPNEADPQPLAKLRGARATVVAVWSGSGFMAKTLLRDLAPDVIERFGKQGVRVVSIATDTPAAEATELAAALGYTGPLLLDADGGGFAKLGSDRLPRVYVLDAEGQIVWFDIEYSQSTRRELRQTLVSLTRDTTGPVAEKPPAP